MSLLEFSSLSVEFATLNGGFKAVDNVSLTVDPGEIVAIVGESGSGKSVSMLAVIGLLPWTANSTADKLEFQGRDMLKMRPRDKRKIIGKDISMIFQEPTTSLNPCFTVDFQITETLKKHTDLSVRNARTGRSSFCAWSAFPHPSAASRPSRISCPAA